MKIDHTPITGNELSAADSANIGDVYYTLGVACSPTGATMDLVEAHKWFDLAASEGNACGARARACVAMDMTPSEVTEAVRRTHATLNLQQDDASIPAPSAATQP